MFEKGNCAAHALRCVVVAFAALFFVDSAVGAEFDFAHRVVPILRQHCVECHGGRRHEGDFSLNTREALLDGGSDLFLDLSLPQWRIQTATAEEAIAVRGSGHPFPGDVRVERIDQTAKGFIIEFEERWDNEGQSWYCREMIRADVVGDTIAEMSVYCTGDWDEAKQFEHASAVKLIRP